MGLGLFLARSVRALFALWFAVVMVEPVSVRACPTAGGVLEQVAVGAKPSSMDHHKMMSKDMTPHEHAPSHDHEKSACTCISDCCGSVSAPLPVLGTFVPVPARHIARAPVFPVLEQSFAEPEYLLPPSTAPPARHSA